MAEFTKVLSPQTTLPLLVIGRDKAVGSFSLSQSGELQVDLNPHDNRSFYRRANALLGAVTKTIGARLLRFPRWSLQRKIDVPHNLGGVPMGTCKDNGVVDHLGRVFGYDNLLVLDGAIIPASLGANPALTIAALAERAMESAAVQLRTEGVISAESDKLESLPVKDATPAFRLVHSSLKQPNGGAKDGSASVDWRGKTILWIPGFLARHMGNHSKCVLARMQAMPLNVVPVPVNTDVDTEQNVVLIQKYIRELSDGEGVIIGHSRGGVMGLDAYRQLSGSDKKKIARILLLQCPINGTPLADLAIATLTRRRLVALSSRLLFSNDIVDTLVELSVRGREVVEHTLPGLTDEDRAKILTFRSTIGRRESPSFELSRLLNARSDQNSDGITPYELSALPGVQDVTLAGYDHEQMVIQDPTLLKRLTLFKPHKEWEAGDVIESLLQLSFLGEQKEMF